MAKRRKLPAPPLVLGRHIARLPEQSIKAGALLALAEFLKKRDLLTDGGKKSLQSGLVGRNEVVSLGLQDVKSCAHGLAESLWKCGQPELWSSLAEDYFQTFDRGKPRRPTHLQRMYLEWSSTLDWQGLVRILPSHDYLWEELRLALERLEDPHPDKDCLLLALACRQTLEPWLEAWRQRVVSPSDLLRLLPYLGAITLTERLRILRDLPRDSDNQDWVRACRCSYGDALGLSLEWGDFCDLEARAVKVLHGTVAEFLDPLFIGAFRAFVTREETVTHLLNSISATDPLRRVVFGARPGQSWLEALSKELRELIALRSELSR